MYRICSAYVLRTVLKHPGKPKEVVELAGFLDSHGAGFIKELRIGVDGGIARNT